MIKFRAMIDPPNSYLSIKQASDGIYKDKGSKFIARAFPVKDLEEIKFSRSFLLGIISGSDSWLRGDIVIDDHLEDEFQSEADSIYKKIAELSLPPVQLSRIKTYVEINSDNMPDIFTVDGDLVDQLLLMTAARGAESLLKNIYDYEEN